MKKEILSKLRKRAEILAKEPEQKREVSAVIEIVKFSLADETYGIESAFVWGVYSIKDITPLPGVPSHIPGIINLRGQILPVIELNKFFNLPETGINELNKVIVLGIDSMEFGISADAVQGTQAVELEDIQEAPYTVTGIGQKYLKGITKENIAVLDAEIILNDETLIINEKVN